METSIDIDALDKAIETFISKLCKAGQLEDFVQSTLRNFYLEVADTDEINEFIKTGKDTSVVLEGWESFYQE